MIVYRSHDKNAQLSRHLSEGCCRDTRAIAATFRGYLTFCGAESGNRTAVEIKRTCIETSQHNSVEQVR